MSTTKKAKQTQGVMSQTVEQFQVEFIQKATQALSFFERLAEKKKPNFEDKERSIMLDALYDTLSCLQEKVDIVNKMIEDLH